jgi:hypothetical protein
MTTPKHISTEFQGGFSRMLRRSWQCADIDPDNVVLDDEFMINQTNDPESRQFIIVNSGIDKYYLIEKSVNGFYSHPGQAITITQESFRYKKL